MGIGMSNGAFFQHALHLHMNPFLSEPDKTPDNNEESPDSIQNKSEFKQYYKVSFPEKS